MKWVCVKFLTVKDKVSMARSQAYSLQRRAWERVLGNELGYQEYDTRELGSVTPGSVAARNCGSN